MKELVVLSGKGGTGKTSLSAVFASLMSRPVLVDCDVDAANLHLVLQPVIGERRQFTAGAKARIDTRVCTGCGRCVTLCRFDALSLNGAPMVNPLRCEGCGVCEWNCPAGAITLAPQLCGEWFVSATACGPMVHARLTPGQENSGRLVSTLRQAARRLAEETGAAWILADGPPGAGCPVISSLTGADYVVLVTEPTVSGFADLRRAAAVVDHFAIPSGVVMNKADLNPAVAESIRAYAASSSRDWLGSIGYDRAFTRAQIQGRSVLALAGAELRRDLEAVWRAVAAAAGRERRVLPVLR